MKLVNSDEELVEYAVQKSPLYIVVLPSKVNFKLIWLIPSNQSHCHTSDVITRHSWSYESTQIFLIMYWVHLPCSSHGAVGNFVSVLHMLQLVFWINGVLTCRVLQFMWSRATRKALCLGIFYSHICHHFVCVCVPVLGFDSKSKV
jgi:hypothetical protein